ncbi:glycoside hydrolase family 13 protein [Halorubrum sp. CSM-61]|uniref:glycoside hydrolase family 13 protein n=1 Tax=Halorubrum sp. CSM-61 TaxID=2485838 RepID=UPI000F4C885B|nr:glycoside hydrolase family 13 protein [Halorubrum sp. CSM-61]
MSIDRAAVDHRPTNSDVYAHDEETVHVRLKTKRGNVERVRLLHADKFDWPESATRTPMRLVGHDEQYDYWQLAVTPPNRRLCYAFHLKSGEERLWLTEWGFEAGTIDDLPTAGERRSLHYFEFPFLHPSNVADPPDWVQDAVFYQIFPERFENGDPSRNPDSVADWGDSPTSDSFFGGDLQGIIDRLDHLDDLGVTALYLTPVFESSSNHKYNTTDYTRIDPQFGDEETLRELVEAAHDLDIRVMLDGVFNHCGRRFEPFQDVVEHGADSEYADWFHVHEFPISFEPRPSYDAFGFEPYMPKLNTENPEVRSYLLDVATYWVEEFGIDGWRLDVANEVDHAFWRDLRREVKAIDPDTYILGEVWHDARPWLHGDQFDAVMNYPFSYAVYEFLTEAEIDASTFADKCTRFLMRYPDRTNRSLFNLLGSHDTERLLHRCGGDERTFRLAMLLLFTYPGAPCVYYGDEVGMTGGDDPDCRRTMVWDETEQNRDLLAFVRRLISLRTDTHPLRRGSLSFDRDLTDGDRLVYRRRSDDGSVAVAINRGSDPVRLPADALDDEMIVLSTGSDAVRSADSGDHLLSPSSGVVTR